MSESLGQKEMDANALLLLGEIRGQLKELIHTNNNLSMEIKGLAVRVSTLEAAEQQRAGAFSLARAFANSPVVGWFVAAAVAAWALIERGLK